MIKDVKLDRTHTEEMDVYLDGHMLVEDKEGIKYKKIVLETVHGVKQEVVPFYLINSEFYER